MPTSSSKKQQDKPAPVALNLDTLEREGRVDQPYVFILGGRRYVLEDVQDADFRDLITAMHAAEQGDFETAMLVILSDADREPFFSNRPIAIHKLKTLFDGYVDHYGLPSPGEADASPGS